MPRLRHADWLRAKVVWQHSLRRLGRRYGLHFVRADFNSPILDLALTPVEVWEHQDPMHGLPLDLDAQLSIIRSELAPYLEEFRPSLRTPEADGFYLENPWFGPMDADLLYAMVRRHRPRTVLELGSGFSSLVIARALEEGGGARHRIVDPFPSPLVGSLEHAELLSESAATVDAGLFGGLMAGDILFVDTSHAVVPGGEVLRVVLEILPTLPQGVIVHFHDFYRPFAYPRVLYERFNLHWQEQYLIQAFLAYNPNFHVMSANHALWRLRRPQVLELFPSLREHMEPSGLWMARCTDGSGLGATLGAPWARRC